MSAVTVTLLTLTVLPIVLAWVSGSYRHFQLGGVDNSEPRKQAMQLEGAGARAIAAQKNAWEALVVLLAALAALLVADYDVSSLAPFLYAFIACRVLHAVFYITDLALLRSLAFIAGYGICVYFMVLAL